MRTRSQARRRQQPQVRQPSVESPNLEKPNNNQETFNPPIVTMDDNRTMAQLLEAPTEGYEDAIVVPEITANNFEIKHGLLNLVQNKQFFGHDKEDPHAHIRYFNKITSTMKFPNVPKLHQLDTFYNALNSNDQDSLNSAAGGNFLDKMPRECLKIIESKSKVRQSRSKAIVSKVSTSSSTPAVSSDVAELKDMVRALILDKKNQTPAPAPVKAIEQSCVTCGGGHSYQNCPATNDYRDNIQEYVSQAAAVNYNQGNASTDSIVYQPQINQPPTFQAPTIPSSRSRLSNTRCVSPDFDNYYTASTLGSGSLPSNTIANPKGDVKAITTRSGVSYNGPQTSSPSKETENEPEVTKDTVQPSTENIQPPGGQTNDQMVEPLTESMLLTLLVKNMFKKYLKFLKVANSHLYFGSTSILAHHLSAPLGGSDFLMEEIDEFLEHDDSIPPGVDGIYDSEGDTVYLEELLSVINSDPNLPPSPVCEINVRKRLTLSCEDPPELELKTLNPILEYAFLEGDD
ncbi:hypothetical protein Tco_0821993 [Tanacetum coccineum]|uniref:Reverse transcriptase domain-containing protein n=1 Tax=Tanacetum coccineum TaxID=301880 RepID=A0ABQ5AI90_9ASTR